MADRSDKPWVVRDVPELTRQTVKVYAAMNHLTMAQAIQLLVSRGIAAGIRATNEPAYGVLRDMPDKVLAELVKRVAEETERRHSMPPQDRLAEETERLRSIGLGQVEPGAQDTDVKRLFAEFVRGTVDGTEE
jgi:hypothetical protein